MTALLFVFFYANPNPHQVKRLAWWKRLRNHLLCVKWDVKPQLIESISDVELQVRQLDWLYQVWPSDLLASNYTPNFRGMLSVLSSTRCRRVSIGWIYGVYSPVESVAFSGNFLHSFAISDQLNVYKLERRLKVLMPRSSCCVR